MKKKIVIRKIPVIYLLETLQDIHSAGVEYVDVAGRHTKYENSFYIIVREECPAGNVPLKFDDRNINDIIV
jgi:hypothetical protein